MIDDLDPVGLDVCLGHCQLDFRVDANEVELSVGSDLVSNFRDSRAVTRS